MSVLDAPLVASPPDIQLSSPPDISTEFTHDPYISSSSSSFLPSGSAGSFHLTMPPSKTPRIPSNMNPFIGADGELDLGDGGAGGTSSYTSSPNRRGRHYPSIHQGLVLPSSGYTTTPKGLNVGLGIGQNTDPTPTRFQTYSSPGNNSPLHNSIRFAGEDSIAGQWLGAGSRRMGDEDEDEMDVDRQGATPTQSPMSVRMGSKRTLSGLGESPMKTAKRSRFASMGTASNHSSIPPSPSRASTFPNGPTHTERSASLAAPPFSTQSRQVSGMSMVSSASTELISPALMPQYDTGYDMMSTFPTSISAPEMSDLSALAACDSYPSPSLPRPYQQPTVAPHDILPPHSSGYRSMPVSVYPSPVVETAAIQSQPDLPVGTSPSLASAKPPYYSMQSSMSLDTIHEVDRAVVVPVEGSAHMTPTIAVASNPPSTGAPANRTLPDGRLSYPVPAYATYPPMSPAMPPTHEYPDPHSQAQDPSTTSAYRSRPTPPQSDMHHTHSPSLPASAPGGYWSGGLSNQRQHGPSHYGQAYQPRHPSQYQHGGHQSSSSVYMSSTTTTYYAPPPAPQHYPYSGLQAPAAPPHLARSVSDSHAFDYGGPSHSQSPYHPAHFQHPSPSSYPSHPGLARSVSTPFVHSGSMPGMSHYPSSGTADGLYPPSQGTASAPMTSSVSLPNAAESSMYVGPSTWDDGAVSGGVGLGFGSAVEHDPHQSYQWESSTETVPQEPPVSVKSTPTTPSRIRHPSIGKRLRPGPKPKRTPKIRRGATAAAARSSPSIADKETSEDLQQSVLPSPELGTAHPPSQFFRPQSRFHTAAGAGPAPESNLELGGPLHPDAVAGPSHYEYATHESQQRHYLPHQQLQRQLELQMHPHLGSSSYAAPPPLRLDPVPRAASPEGHRLTDGIPTEVIDRMFVTYMSTDGAQPGKRFKCLIEGCEREFPRKSAIKSHIQTHLDDKPFVCGVPDCAASFVRQHDLKRHMKIHTGHKPFPCDCGKIFARGDALRRHRERNLTSICSNGEKLGDGR